MDALEYAQNLCRFESTSNLSNIAVSDYAEESLKRLGFDTERIEFDDPDGVRKANIVGRIGPKPGEAGGGMAYFGHTDVVPADPWFTEDFGPFEPTIIDGRLYGRGTCDMKGSIACMLAAADAADLTNLKAPVYITCTADEEVGYRGAKQVVARSKFFKEMVEHRAKGIIGEPTMLDVVHAHKGGCGFHATSHGKAAHSSTNEGLNANLAMIPFLSEMKALHDETLTDPKWRNEAFDPPTVKFNIGINDYTYAINITPPQSICTVYFRPMPGMDPTELLDRIRACADEHGIELEGRINGQPLWVDPSSEIVQDVLEVAGREESHTVSYGTDGGALTELQDKLVFGPGNIAQAHTHDEFISLEQLELGTEMYSRLIDRWCR